MKTANTIPTTPRFTSRISFNRIRNRLFDVERLRALPEQYEFQDEIDSLSSALFSKVTRAYPWPKRFHIPAWAKTYRRRIRRITKEFEACENFAFQISAAQISLCGDIKKYRSLANELAAARTQEINALASAQPPDKTLPLRGHLFEMPPEEFCQRLDQSLDTYSHQIYQRLFRIILALRDHNIVGRITWNRPDVCEFSYSIAPIRIDEISRTTHEPVRKNTRTKRRNGRVYEETEIEHATTCETLTTHFETRCIATLVGARSLPYPAPRIPKPQRVKALFEAAPASLRPYLHVVDGYQTHYRRIDKELRHTNRQHVTRKTEFESEELYRDPCLAIGPKYGPTTALAGWNYDDFGGQWAYFWRRQWATLAYLLRYTGLPLPVSPFFATYRLLRAAAQGNY